MDYLSACTDECKEKKGTMVTVTTDSKTVKQNFSLFKVIPPNLLNLENQEGQEVPTDNSIPPAVNPCQNQRTESLI